MKKKTPAQECEEIRKKCVTIAKHIARLVVGEKCEHCGRTKAQGWQMHGAHIYPEGVYKGMSADIDNILCLCAQCHTGGFWKNSNKKSWHEDPMYFADWFREKYPERAKLLKERSLTTISLYKQFWEEKLEKLKGIEKMLLKIQKEKNVTRDERDGI